MQESSAMNFKIAIVLLQLLTTSYASSDDFELACDSANPSAKTNVTCVCRRTVGNGIQWVLNGTQISECVFNDTCLPTPDGYTFLINVFAYKMTKIDYDYNDCTQINCRDLSNTSAQLMVVPSAINFDSSNPTPIAEPAFSHNNGMFSITTGCISGYMHVTCEWYTFNNGAQEEYTQGQSAFVMFNKSSCSNCNDDDNAKMTCGFYHIEASGNETKNVYFRVVVTHIPTNLKWEVNSTNVYTIKDSYTTSITNPAANATDSQWGTTTSSLKNSSTPNHPITTSSPTMQHTLIATTVKYKTELLIDRDMVLYIGFSSMIFIFIVVIACYLFLLLKLMKKTKATLNSKGKEIKIVQL